MSESVRKVFASLVLFAIPTVLFSAANAQTKANCTFHLFKSPGIPSGVNDYGTVVGETVNAGASKGFVRYSNGTVSYFQAPNAQATFFIARNNAGVTVGGYSLPSQVTPVPGAGLILSGSKFTSVKYPNAVWTALYGINKYNTTVGVAGDLNYQGHAFKRYSSGSFVTLQYPGAQDTWPRAINDHGTIVGTAAGHGFIYHGGGEGGFSAESERERYSTIRHQQQQCHCGAGGVLPAHQLSLYQWGIQDNFGAELKQQKRVAFEFGYH